MKGQNTPESARQESYEHAIIGGRLGKRWTGPFNGEDMTNRPLPPKYEALNSWRNPPNRLLLRMSDGDIVMIGVRNPKESDNARRGYWMTSVRINEQRPSGSGQYTVIPLQYETVRDLVASPGEHLVLSDPGLGAKDGRPQMSVGSIEEIVSYDRTASITYSDPASYPSEFATTILDDFQARVSAAWG